jgi:hypothetical protein
MIISISKQGQQQQNQTTGGSSLLIQGSDTHILWRMFMLTYLWVFQSHVNAPQKERERLIRSVVSLLLTLFQAPHHHVLGSASGGGGGGESNQERHLVVELEEASSPSSSSSLMIIASPAQMAGMIDTAWTLEELFALLEWCATQHQIYDQENTPAPFFSRILPRIFKVIQELRTISPSSFPPGVITVVTTTKGQDTDEDNVPTTLTSSSIIHKRHHLPLFDSDSPCLLDHYDHELWLPINASMPMTEAPHKLQELKVETGAGFLWFTLLFSHCVKGIMILVLFNLFFLRGAQERQFDRSIDAD